MSDKLAHKIVQRRLQAEGDRDIPKTVKRYVEEHKEQGMGESKAWAISWSRYCRYKNPDSPHCKKDPDEYFTGRGSSSNRVTSRIADSVTHKAMAEYVEIDGVKYNKDTLRRLNDKNMQKAEELAEENRHIEITFKYVDNDPDKNNRMVIVDSGGHDYWVTPIPLEALDFVRFLELWTEEDAEQARREIEQRSSRVATELAQEYAEEFAEQEREITIRFQHNEYGNPEVAIEDTEGPDGIIGSTDDFAILARTIDYWFAPGDEKVDAERDITEMKGKEYKEASILVEFNDLRSQTRHEIVSWLQQLGESVEDVALSKGTITKESDKKGWLRTKTKYEGDPDPVVVDEICDTAPIRRPVILDYDQDTLVEGRHRMAAGLQCDIDVPVIIIDRHVAGRIASRIMRSYRMVLPSTFHDKLRRFVSDLSQRALRPFPTEDPERYLYNLISHLKQEMAPFLPDDVELSEDKLERLVSDMVREGQIELEEDDVKRVYQDVVDATLDEIDSQLLGQLNAQLNDMTEEAAQDVSTLPSMKSAVRLLKKLGVSEYEAQQMLDELVKRLEIKVPFDDQQIDSIVNTLFA